MGFNFGFFRSFLADLEQDHPVQVHQNLQSPIHFGGKKNLQVAAKAAVKTKKSNFGLRRQKNKKLRETEEF